MSPTRSRARFVAVALVATAYSAVAIYAVGACTTFEESPADLPDVASPPPRVDGESPPDASTDAADAADVFVPYCRSLDGSLLCNEFPMPPITLGWSSAGNDAGGTAEWTSEAGATEPGAGVFATGPVGGAANSARIYLSRGVPIPTKPPNLLRLELALRFDESPPIGSTAVLRFFTGTGIFYIHQSQLGYSFTHDYYAPFCSMSPPCNGAEVEGTKPPIAPKTWDRLSITIEKKAEAGAGCTIVFAASSGERIAVESPPGFTPDILPNAYLDVGFTIVSPAAKQRVFVVDDLSVTAN